MSSTPTRRAPIQSIDDPALATREAASIVLGLWIETYNLAEGITSPNVKESRTSRKAMDNDTAEEWMAELARSLAIAATETERLGLLIQHDGARFGAFNRVMTARPELTNGTPQPADRKDWIDSLTLLAPHERDAAIIGAVSPSFLALLRCFNLAHSSDLLNHEQLPVSVQQRVSPEVLEALGDAGTRAHRYFEYGGLIGTNREDRYATAALDIRRIKRTLDILKVEVVAPVVRAAIDVNAPLFTEEFGRDAFRAELERPTRRRRYNERGRNARWDQVTRPALKYGSQAAWTDLAANSDSPRSGARAAWLVVRHELNNLARDAGEGSPAGKLDGPGTLTMLDMMPPVR